MPATAETAPLMKNISLTDGFEPFAREVRALEPRRSQLGLAIITDSLGMVQMGGGSLTPEVGEDVITLFGDEGSVATSFGRIMGNHGVSDTLAHGQPLELTRDDLDRFQALEAERYQGDLPKVFCGYSLWLAVSDYGIQNQLLNFSDVEEHTLPLPVVHAIWTEVSSYSTLEETRDSDLWTQAMDDERNRLLEVCAHIAAIGGMANLADTALRPFIDQDRDIQYVLPKQHDANGRVFQKEVSDLHLLGMGNDEIADQILHRLTGVKLPEPVPFALDRPTSED